MATANLARKLYTAHPWAWAILLVGATCELGLGLVMLAQPNEMMGLEAA